MCDYPEIFDKDDERLVESQAKHSSHFYEWLAAVLIYNLTGYFSLVEKYQFKNHLTKRDKLKKILPDDLVEIINDSKMKGAQFPDLLVYKEDFSDWFFCEVKGPTDFLRKSQIELFDQIELISKKEIRIIQFERKPKR